MSMVSSSHVPPAPGDDGAEATRDNLTPMSLASRSLESALRGDTTPHVAAGQAPLAQARARLQEARRRRDRDEEATNAAEVARAMAARSSELDTVLLLARRSLALRDDPGLRLELAGWLASVGERRAAAAELRRVSEALAGGEAADGWARVGDVLGRGGEAVEAAEAMRRAIEHEPSSPLWHESLGALSFWSPEEVRPAVGAAAFLDGAQLRWRSGDTEGALEDRRRAAELSTGVDAAEAVAELLASLGRQGAADEVLRAVAARSPDGALAAHRRRVRRALEERDVVRALGAALDGGFDERGGDDGTTFDVLLDLAGFTELLVARMEIRAEASAGEERAELYADLARSLAGPLGRPEQAAAAWRRVLEEVPQHAEALEGLGAGGGSAEREIGEEEARRLLGAGGGSPAERAGWRLVLCRAARQRGDRVQALREALAVLESSPEHREALAMTAALGALVGSAPAKIEALVGLSAGKIASVQATVLAWASEAMSAQGDEVRALRLAERASHADPSLPRAAVTLAQRLSIAGDRIAAVALERAAALGVLQGEVCARLVALHLSLEQPAAALGWARRRASLRPGDPEALGRLLQVAIQAQDAEQIEQAIDWVLALPVPAPLIASPLSDALRALVALDARRAVAVAHRALEVLDPREASLRGALVAVGQQGGEPALVSTVLERWLAGGCPAGEAKTAWLEAARAHQQRGDAVSAARALWRASHAGADPAEVLSRLEASEASDPEARLAAREVHAEAVAALGVKHHTEAAALWREVGAARWDWARDQAGMVRAWVRAAELEPIQGPGRLVRDLFAFVGPGTANEELLQYAEQKKDPREAASVLSLAALAALLSGDRQRSFDTAERAMRLDPYHTEALAVAESAVEMPAQLDRMEAIYERLVVSAKGRFGRRATHYRAARALEGWSLDERAVSHALSAFEEVPSPGTPFRLMMRLARRAGASARAVEALGRVARQATSAADRWGWWMRAAEACEEDREGAQRRLEVLGEALSVQPDRRTVETFASALADLVDRGWIDRGEAVVRWQVKQRDLLAKVDGPDGVRVSLTFAEAALKSLDEGDSALEAIGRALDLDADLEEYATLLPWAERLAAAELARPESGPVERCRALLRRPYANVGLAALQLCARLALLRRDRDASLALLMKAASSHADEEPMVAEVERALRVFAEDSELTAQLTRAFPTARGPEPGGPEEQRREAIQLAAAARQAGDVEALAAALEQLGTLEPDLTVRRGVLRELAALRLELGDTVSARALWERLLEMTPGDRESLLALEQIALDANDHESLTSLLDQRAQGTDDPDERRVLRLRRAALLEQRLGRIDDARRELERLLEQQPEDPSATRFLADLLERQGQLAAAGTHWMRAFRHQMDPRDRSDLAIRAAQAFVRAGELDAARQALDAALLVSRSERLLELRVEIERAAENLPALADALDELAIASMASPEQRAELLVEAAEASLSSGDETAALERAQRAARIAPHVASAQLLARSLEYRARGAGTPQDAAQCIEELRRIHSGLSPARIPLHAFLLAEALDAVQGGNAGMRELAARHAEFGAAPLIALGMAERLARSSSFAASLVFFEAALAGDLQGLRRRGSVALAAADAAQRVEDLEQARTYLEEATRDPLTVATARQRLQSLEQLEQQRSEAEASDPRRSLHELALRAVGLERARLLAQIARLTAPMPGERAEADRLFTEAIAAAYLDPVLRMELEAEREVLRGVGRSSRPPPLPAPSQLPPIPATAPVPAPTTPPAAGSSTSDLVRLSSLVDFAPPTEVVVSEQPIAETDRVTLIPGASLEVRQRFLLDPSQGDLLRALRDAAQSDHNPTHGRALDHVLRLFSPGESPQPPPPLSAQREEPEAVTRMLARGVSGAASEALGLIWEGASQLFRRDAGTYGVTGLDRVSLSGTTLLCRLYATTARVMGTSRTPLFQRRSHGPVSASIALLTPPSVILAGDPRDETPELLFRLGAAFGAAWPEHALVFGLPDPQLRALLAALLSAFGPPPTGPVPSSNVASLAASLWQGLPTRAQRRMKELCASPSDFSLERVLGSARRISHRAGLLLSGDLGVTLQEVIAEEQLPLKLPTSFAELAVACERHPQILDLLAMATSPEYADARWRPGDRLRRSPSGTFRPG